jgi:rare lipoprotein A
MKYAAASALVIIVTIPLMAEAFASQPSTYAREGNSIIWKIDGVKVWEFPVAYAAEVSELSARFNRLYGAGFKLVDLNMESSNGTWSLLIGKDLLYSISPAYTKSQRLDPKSLALRIMSNIYGVVGKKNAAELTSAYQIRGKYDISASVSWYGEKFVGRKFANGERFKETHLTAAAKSLPFGTLVKVTAPSGKSVVVRITDRFKEHKDRVLDISPAAAEILEIKNAGVSKARIEVIGRVEAIGGK